MAKVKDSTKEAQAWLDYAELSGFFFSENAPANINEIGKDSKYYKEATEMAKELDMDWNNLSQDDSNCIMINMLNDYYMNIMQSRNAKYQIKISIIKTEDKK